MWSAGAGLRQLVTEPTTAVFDDLLGGLVGQDRTWVFGDDVRTMSIWHARSGSREAETIIVPASDDLVLSLEDVQLIDDAVHVFYATTTVLTAPQETVLSLRVRNLSTGSDRLIADFPGWETDLTVSIGGVSSQSRGLPIS